MEGLRPIVVNADEKPTIGDAELGAPGFWAR
jgi:hypothetical protein